MPVYRYKLSAAAYLERVKKQIPPADAASLSSVASGAEVIWDVSALTTSKTDLDDFFAQLGWVFVETDPADTPAAAAAALVPAGSLDIDHADLGSVSSDQHHAQAHGLGSADHELSTLAQLNAKVSDATLIDTGDSRLSDARLPLSHASTHASGGSDAVKLDDLTATDDNTDLNSSISKHGLLLKLGGGSSNYLRADGTWNTPPGGGDVTAAANLEDNKGLRGDGGVKGVETVNIVYIKTTDNLATILNAATSNIDFILEAGAHTLSAQVAWSGLSNVSLVGGAGVTVTVTYAAGTAWTMTGCSHIHVEGFNITDSQTQTFMEFTGACDRCDFVDLGIGGTPATGQTWFYSRNVVLEYMHFDKLHYVGSLVIGSLIDFVTNTGSYHDIQVKDCYIEGHTSMVDGLYAVRISTTDFTGKFVFDSRIADCTFEAFDNGIFLNRWYRGIVHNNILAGNGAAATDFGIYDSSGFGNSISGNSISGQTGVSHYCASIGTQVINNRYALGSTYGVQAIAANVFCSGNGFNSMVGPSIYVSAGAGTVLNNNNMTQCGSHGIEIGGTATRCSMGGNVIDGTSNSGVGILVTAGADHNISACNIIDTAGEGVSISGVEDSVPRCRIVGCTVNNAGSIGLDVDFAALGILIQGCFVYDSSGDGLNVEANGCTITGCLVDTCTANAFEIGDQSGEGTVTNAVVQGNVARSATGVGFLMTLADSVVTGNLAQGNTGNGFESTSNSDNTHFADNKSEGNGATFVFSGTNRTFGLQQDATVVDNALVRQDGTSGRLVQPSPIIVTDAGAVSGVTTYNGVTVTAHGARHASGGADAVKLDDMAATDDNTDLNATTTKHGLLLKLGGGTTNFLRADGTWAAPAGGGSSIVPHRLFQADQLESPVSSNWAINALAPLIPDASNTALSVRAFDDTTVEGIGFSARVPTGATSIILGFLSRAASAPGGSVNVGLNLYKRVVPDNAVIPAWGSATALTNLAFTTNAYFQKDSQTITLATLGLTAGVTYLFELCRNVPTDTLSGDWLLHSLLVGWS